MSSRTEIRMTGFGGQGVVLATYVTGAACAVHSPLHATMIQSFGPEARGAACAATLVVSDSEVLYPYTGKTDILVALSTDGYEKYRNALKDDGVLIHEKNLVAPSPAPKQKVYAIPSTAIAESLGRTLVQNIVMLGFFAAVTKITSREAMLEAVKQSVPAGTEEMNLKAFEAGWKYFEENYG